MLKIKAILVLFIILLSNFMFLKVSFASSELTNSEGSQLGQQVERIWGNDRYQTASEVAQNGWASNSDYAVIAAGMNDNLIDALTVAPLAKLRNAPIIFTTGDNLNPFAEAELRRLSVKSVYITSGLRVIEQPVIDKLLEMGISIIPLGGNDRFETSVNIAREISAIQPSKKIIITTAWENADALSIAPIAATLSIPILLTDLQSFPESMNKYIDSIKGSIDESYILGLEKVVSKDVENIVPNPVRIGGIDRYATNREVLKTFADQIKLGKIFFANGENDHLVDALACAPLAARTFSPIVLTEKTIQEDTIEFIKKNYLTSKLIVIGSDQLITKESLDIVNKSLQYLTDEDIKGSKDNNSKELISENVIIQGDSVSLKNADLAFSINIEGNNCLLQNVNVNGTIFINPGERGTTHLDNVKANKIIVLSGSIGSIHFNNVDTALLRVDSTSKVRVESNGNTEIRKTIINSQVILDNLEGNFGQIEIDNILDPYQMVEFKGKYDQSVILHSHVSLKIHSGSKITRVDVVPDMNQQIFLDGIIDNLNINKKAKVSLLNNTVVSNLISNVNSEIIVASSARVLKFDPKDSGTVPSGGGLINGTKTSEQSQIPSKLPKTDEEIITADTQALTEDIIKGKNIDLKGVKSNLTLPNKGNYGSSILWTSSNPSIISNNGIVDRPIYTSGSPNIAISLTAMIQIGSKTEQKVFSIIVNKISVKDLVKSMKFDVTGSVKEIPFVIDDRRCTATFTSEKDTDFINYAIVNVTRDLIFKTFDIDNNPIEKELKSGENILTISDMGLPDSDPPGGAIENVKGFSGWGTNGILFDPVNNFELNISFKFYDQR